MLRLMIYDFSSSESCWRSQFLTRRSLQPNTYILIASLSELFQLLYFINFVL